MQRFLRFILVACVLGVVFHCIVLFCHRQTDNFTLARIHSDLPFNPAWEISPLSPEKKIELKQLFNQKFYYLGCGGQCFAFASEDGNYVIKFFKHKIRKPFTLFLKIPLPGTLNQKRLKKWNRALFKHNRDFNSYKIAYEDLREETGLVYIHLNKSDDLNQLVTIVDKIGIVHQIDLDKIEFIVQKRAKLVYTYIEEVMTQKNLQEAKTALHSLLNIIISRCKKGIFDEDARIHRNFGFIGTQPIFIDVGRFKRDPERTRPSVYKNDLLHIIGRFRQWLEKSYPELVLIFDEQLHEFQQNT